VLILDLGTNSWIETHTPVTERTLIDQEPTDQEPIPSVSSAPKSPRALSRVQRDLSDDELESPGARKLLLARLDEAEGQLSRLTDICDKYHEADKKVAVLSEKLKNHYFVEALYGAALSIGALLVGLSPTIWQSHPHVAYSLIAAGAVLMGGAIAAKVYWK